MSQENMEIVRQVYEAIARRESATVLALYDPEVVLINTRTSLDTAPYLGHDGLLRWTRDVRDGMGEFRVEADEIIDVDESRVVVVGRVCGEGRVSGLPIEVPLSTVFTLMNGRIVRMQAYDTKAEALQAVGLEEHTTGGPERHL
jgi:ketosteroid isomerase-like protein